MFDEFQFLAADAKKVGRVSALPVVERETFTASSGRSISGLRFTGLDTDTSATPFVFLHGAGLNAHTFDPTILALGDDSFSAEVFSMDLPGHGRSEWREDGNYSPYAMAADVVSVMKQVFDRPVNLVGHSLGALTGCCILSEAPELLASLMVVDITPGIRPNKDAGSVSEFISGQKEFNSIDEIIDRAIKFNIGHDRTALRRGITLNTRVNDSGLLEWTHHLAHLDGLPATSSKSQSPSSESVDNPFVGLWEPLKNARIPLALVRGTEGFVSDEMLDEWEDLLPDSTVHTIMGGHNLHEHNPVGLSTTIKSFTQI